MERFLSNDRLIASYRNKLDVTIFPDDKLNMAYLDNKFEQFLLHLQTGDDDMIIKVIKEINNQLQDGAEVFKYSLNHPKLFEKIFEYLQNHKNETIRELCSLCFKQFCLVLTTKEFLNKGNYIKNIVPSFDDSNINVRINIYEGLIYYCQSRYGCDTLFENNILKAVIIKLDKESEMSVIELILILLNQILTVEKASELALQLNVIKILKKYINSDQNNIKENILLNYGSLSLCEQGKTACVEEGTIIYIN